MCYAGKHSFLISIIVAVVIGFAYLRDLGDISQMLMRVKRKHMIRFINIEKSKLGLDGSLQLQFKFLFPKKT